MKKLLLLAFIAAFSLQSYAYTCADVDEIATEVMILRQSGVPLQDILNISKIPWVEEVARSAYTYPKYTFQPTQILVVEDFVKYWFDLCSELSQNRKS